MKRSNIQYYGDDIDKKAESLKFFGFEASKLDSLDR